MPHYKAEIRYRYGSGKPSSSMRISSSALRGNTESAVMEFLREKHRNIKDLQIIIEKIEWK